MKLLCKLFGHIWAKEFERVLQDSTQTTFQRQKDGSMIANSSANSGFRVKRQKCVRCGYTLGFDSH